MGLYKRKDSPYWWMSFRIEGRRIFESTGTNNKKLAARKHKNRIIELQESQLGSAVKIDGKTPFCDLANQFLKWSEWQRAYKDKQTHVKYLIKAFGRLKLKDFTTLRVDFYCRGIIDSGRTVSTANRYLQTLKAMFTKAVDWELVEEDVLKRVRRVKLIPENNRRLRFLSRVEGQALINACEPHLKPIVITALNTGMRREEILSLEWEKHVDLKHGFILLDRTKNGERREVPINQTLRSVFQGLVRHINSPYVFTDSAGRRFRDLKRSFSSACRKAEWEKCSGCSYERQKSGEENPGNCLQCGKEMFCVAGINDFRFHDLRHTFASWLVMAGVDLTTVSRLLGHKSLTMTLRYSHLAPSHMVKAVAVLENGYNSEK
jgi:integrase